MESGRSSPGSFNKVMLVGAIAPAFSRKVSGACFPFGAMALSAYLKKKGIECEVVSTAFPQAAERIFKSLNGVSLIGISSMSGPYLGYAALIAKNIKKVKPGLPIVWGGPHASLMDEDLITKDFADFVIRGTGEIALFELIRSLKKEVPFSSVPGLTWIENGRIIKNSPDSNFDINQFPQLDYSFLPDENISILRNEFSYFSSRGCPFDCSYCVAAQIYGRRWHNKSEDKVFEELKEAHGKYGFKSVLFWDDNLMVNIPRLFNILLKLERSGVRFQWSGFCRADVFSRLSDDDVRELKKTGLRWLSFGAESGSQRILNRLSKQITVDNIKRTVEKLKKHNISCDFSFMGGIPGEEADDFYKTLDLIQWMKKIYPQAAVRLFRFIPYPKMPILNDNKDIVKFLPENSEEWRSITYQNKRFPWVPKQVDRALTILSSASLYSEKPAKLSLGSLPVTILYYLTQLRLKNKFFYFPLEGIMMGKIYEIAAKRVFAGFAKEVEKSLQ